MKERDVFEVLFQTTDLLRSLRLQHVVVGAFAFAALGGARGTMDVDFMVLAEPQTLEHAKEMAEKQGFGVDLAWLRENPLLKDLQVRLVRRGIPVDVRQRIEGLFDSVLRGDYEPYELKLELDRWGLFEEYEDRFLSVFRKGRY